MLFNSTDSSHDMQNNENKKEISNFRRALPQFCVVGVKNVILLGWGLILGYPTILIPGLQYKGGNLTSQPDFVLNADEISWIGSINLLCVPLGSLTSGLLMDPIGKRRMMQLLNVPMLVAWALFFFAKDITQIYLALRLSGMSGGLLEAPLLIYIAETVQPQYRGMLTASGTATVLGGVCLQFIIGSMLHWRTVAAISAIVPFIAFNAVFLVPESPYWLCATNRTVDAQKSLQWLRGWVPFAAVQVEFQNVIRSVEDLQAEKRARAIEQANCSAKLKPFKKRGFVAPFILILVGFIFGHFSGMTPLQTYAIQIFGLYRVPINEYYATVFLGGAQVVGCLIGMVFVRSAGKRRLVFASFIGCGLCFFAVATQSHLREGSYQTDFKLNSMDIKISIDQLEQNVLVSVVTLRKRIESEITDQAVKTNSENETISSYVEQRNQTVNTNTNAFRHIHPQIIAEILKLALYEENLRKFSETNPEKLREFLENAGLFVSSAGIKINSTALANGTVRTDSEKLFDLLSISKNIIVPFMELREEIKLTTLRIVDEIEQDVWNPLISNDTITESHLASRINELSRTLQAFVQELTLGNAADEGNDNYRWMPMILLLCGSMFAHCGAKLFPWMLIGEVYPMEVRSAAAGFSSAIGYLIGFLSNKLFLTMIAAFTLNGTFWFYSAVAIIGCFVLYFTLPETENKTLEEIQAFFVKRDAMSITKMQNQSKQRAVKLPIPRHLDSLKTI